MITAQNRRQCNHHDCCVSDKRYSGGLLNFDNDRMADLRLPTAPGPHDGYPLLESRPLNLGIDMALMYVRDDCRVAPVFTMRNSGGTWSNPVLQCLPMRVASGKISLAGGR